MLYLKMKGNTDKLYKFYNIKFFLICYILFYIKGEIYFEIILFYSLYYKGYTL